MVSPTVYRGLILNTPQVVYAPAKLEKCHLMKGLENESQLEIVGTQIRGLCKSICGSSESGRQFTAIKSELDEMKADHSISLEKTSAKTIRLTKGSLTIKSCKLAYEKLTAPRIVASDIASIKIHCKELDASLCTFTSVRSGVKSKMTDSVVKKSFAVSVKESSTITLDLQNTVIDKDLIIEASLQKTKKLAEEAINAPMTLRSYNDGVLSCGKLILGAGATVEHRDFDFTLGLSRKYASLDEVPEEDKSFFAAIVGEGKTGHLGDFECLVKNGRVELHVPTPKKINIDPSLDSKSLTLSILKQRLGDLERWSSTNTGIEFLGGRFREIGGKLCMIKAPPNLNLVANPSVKVEIIGGLIKGEIRLKNCHGTIDHIFRSTVPNPSSREAGHFSFFQKTDQLPAVQQENIILAKAEKKDGAALSVVSVADHPHDQKDEPAQEQPVEDVFVRVFPEDPEDDDFMCPITFERMTNPYRIPTKHQTHAVDYDSLMLLCQGKGEFVCPFTDKKFKLSDCKPDLEMKAHLEKALLHNNPHR